VSSFSPGAKKRDGSTSAKNKTYNDIVFLVEFKSFSEVKNMTADQAW